MYSYLRKYAMELGVGSDQQLEACRKELNIPDTRVSAKPVPVAKTDGGGNPFIDSGSSRNIILIIAGTALVLALLVFVVLLLV